MQKNKLNLHIYGAHLLKPYKTVVSHLKSFSVHSRKVNLGKYVPCGYARIICFRRGGVQCWYFFFPAGGYSCLVLETTSLYHRNIPTGFGQVLVSSISL